MNDWLEEGSTREVEIQDILLLRLSGIAMKLQTKAVNVLERTSSYLKAGVLSNKPAWMDVVGSHPPSKYFLHEPKAKADPPSFQLGHGALNKKPNGSPYKTRLSQRKGKNMYKPNKLRFVEDELRSLFYEQHPWELSRPKILLENTGEDANSQDWSTIKQLNKPLDGESVVQRTLHLLNVEKKTLNEAYDQARFEFYRVRMEEEMEDLVSREESEMFGAVFKDSPLEHGIKQEQKVIDQWKIDATELSKIIQAKRTKPEDQ